MNNEELIQLGAALIVGMDKDIGRIMSERELYEYWDMLIDKTFKPIKCQDQSDSRAERGGLPYVAKYLCKLIGEVCFEDLIRERKEKKIDYADHRDIYSIVLSMMFYECFKEKVGDEWPGLNNDQIFKSSLTVVRSLR